MTPAELKVFVAGLRLALLTESDTLANPPIDCAPVGRPTDRATLIEAERDLVEAARAYRSSGAPNADQYLREALRPRRRRAR